jgi:hypothetical protein
MQKGLAYKVLECMAEPGSLLWANGYQVVAALDILRFGTVNGAAVEIAFIVDCFMMVEPILDILHIGWMDWRSSYQGGVLVDILG